LTLTDVGPLDGLDARDAWPPLGNWIAYQADGLEAIVRYLRGCLGIFAAEFARDGNPLEAIRRSDLQIVHKA
jgi:hypothetical protein